MTMYTPNLDGRTGPKYRNISDAMAEDMRRGVLKAGTKLPTHRELAYRVGVTVGTITRAYQELQRQGFTGGRVGSGTYVVDRERSSHVFPVPARPIAPGDSPELAHSPVPDGQIDLSMNRLTPGPEAEALAYTLGELSHSAGLSVLTQYNPAPGLAHHRRAMAQLLGDVGLDCEGDDIILTSGAQHAMAAASLALLKAGDVVLTESLTYPGMTSLASHLSVRVRHVEMDEFGMRPDALESAVRETGARVVYLMPIHQNPTTVTMNKARLGEIARIAQAHDLVLIEDDIYGFQPSKREPPLAQLAPDNTIYISGFAKSISPGLRVGCIKAPKGLFNAVTQAVQITGWMIPPLMGEIAARWITSGTARDLIKWHRAETRARYAMAVEILDGFSFKGGPECLHLWMDLPDGHHADDTIRELRSAGVILAGPESFITTQASIPRALRLCLGSPPSREQLRTALEQVRNVLTARPIAGLAKLDMMVM